jgi:hypothetical protein
MAKKVLKKWQEGSLRVLRAEGEGTLKEQVKGTVSVQPLRAGGKKLKMWTGGSLRPVKPKEEVVITKAQMNKWSADAEALMMGFTIALTSIHQWEFTMNYIKKVLDLDYDTDLVYKGMTKYLREFTIHHMNLSVLDGMKMITTTISTDEDTEPYNLLSENGVFGYVYNEACPDFSELGYSYYKKKGAKVVRVG